MSALIMKLLAIGGFCLMLLATLAAFVSGFSVPNWVVPLGGAMGLGALVMLIFGILC